MSRNRYIIDLPDDRADAIRADAAAEHLSVTAHIKRVLLLDSDRRRKPIDPPKKETPS